MNTHETRYHKPRHITRHAQKNSVCVWREDEAWGDATHPTTPSPHRPPPSTTLNFSAPFVCRLKPAESCRSRWSYINPTQYGSVLGSWSLPKPSLLFSHDAEGSAEHPQPNLQQVWVGGGSWWVWVESGVGAVFTCVLCQGTELSVHTGL